MNLIFVSINANDATGATLASQSMQIPEWDLKNLTPEQLAQRYFASALSVLKNNLLALIRQRLLEPNANL